MRRRSEIPLVLMTVAALSPAARAARVKDLATLRGVRSNQLVGYGLVVGLAGTGDRAALLTEGSLGLALKGLGVDVKSKKLETQNAAAVICSAELPPFSRVGSRVDVTVSSVGTASSLSGGTLVLTALRGPDGKVYAMAQGKLVTPVSHNAATGQLTTEGTTTTLSVPGGALVEKEVPFDFAGSHELRYQLRHPDFTTAARIAHRINEELGGKFATAVDGGTISVIPPYSYDANPVELVAQIESLDIEADAVAKVVINPRTGTVVLGNHVRVMPVAVAHRNLRIEIKEPRGVASAGGAPAANVPVTPATAAAVPASQAQGVAPAELPATAGEIAAGLAPSLGTGPVVATTPAAGKGKTQSVFLLEKGASIGDIVDTLNAMGATADDLVALIQSLKASGALIAEVEVQ